MGWLPRIQINEVMVSGSEYFVDVEGNKEPWIELFNGDSGDIDISGYHLSNDPANPTFSGGGPHQRKSISLRDQ